MKWFSLGLMVVLFGALFADALADDPHYAPRETITNNYNVETSQAMALAVSEINPTVVSSKWQMGVGFGVHNDETAIAIGLARRINKNLLFSGKIANQNGSVGTSVGLNFKF